MASAATDLEMMERQRQGFNSKVEELQSNKASNSRFLTREEQEQQIKTVGWLSYRRGCPTKKYDEPEVSQKLLKQVLCSIVGKTE